jgi:hypothetical protein
VCAGYRNLVLIHLHCRSKVETTSDESDNSLLCQYLARFRRKTERYSKRFAAAIPKDRLLSSPYKALRRAAPSTGIYIAQLA